MNVQLILSKNIQIVGDLGWRGECPLEDNDLITTMEWIKREYPAFTPFHAKNEKKRRGKQFAELKKERMKSAIVTGWSDVCVPGFPTLFIEIKRRDHTQSEIFADQVDFLVKQQNIDCWCFVALGWQAAIDCFMMWLKENYPNMIKKTCNHKSAEVISISPKPR